MENKETIISTYKKVHHIIFSYGILIGIGVLGAYTAYTILFPGNEQVAQAIPIGIERIQELEKKLQKQSTQADEIPSILPIVMLGETKNTLEEFNSYNNVLTYKGFVAPRYFGITRTVPLQPIEYYDKGNYTKDEMETIFRNIIIGSNKANKEPIKNQQITLPESITATFHLECLTEEPLFKGACSVLTKNFLTSLPFLNINSQEQEIQTLWPKIEKDRTLITRGCKQREKYMLYAKDYKPWMPALFLNCSEEEKDQLNQIMNTIETENELANKIITTKTYQNNTINIYKLLSFAQVLYDDIQNKRINTDRIKSFLAYQEELLRKKKLSRFYKDVIYYTNNYYIKTLLSSSETRTSTREKQEIEQIQKTISTINNGSDLLGYAGISDEVNKNLIIKEVTTVETTEEKETGIQDIENAINQMQNFQITEKKQIGSGILLKGIRALNKMSGEGEKTTTITIEMELEENDKIIIAKNIRLHDYPEIESTINQLITNNKRSFSEVQKYISANTTLFNKENTITDTKTFCSTLQIQGGQITSCNSNAISIDFLRNNKIVTINIMHSNFIISNIDFTNEEAKNNFQKILLKGELGQSINTTKISSSFLDQIINSLRNYVPEKTEAVFTGSSIILITIDKVKQYLGVQPSDVIEKNGKILIAFTIKNIEFIGGFDSSTNTISSLYFKNVLTNNSPTFIKNIQLILDETHKSEDEQFSLNPLSYIKEKSPEIYLYYQQFISNNH